jgi:hypothetical protein
MYPLFAPNSYLHVDCHDLDMRIFLSAQHVIDRPLQALYESDTAITSYRGVAERRKRRRVVDRGLGVVVQL